MYPHAGIEPTSEPYAVATPRPPECTTSSVSARAGKHGWGARAKPIRPLGPCVTAGHSPALRRPAHRAIGAAGDAVLPLANPSLPYLPVSTDRPRPATVVPNTREPHPSSEPECLSEGAKRQRKSPGIGRRATELRHSELSAAADPAAFAEHGRPPLSETVARSAEARQPNGSREKTRGRALARRRVRQQ